MKNIISILFALGILLHTCAQPTRQYTFTHYSTATGLQSNQVNSVTQDATGYIWFATTEGLVRFDGIRYKTFQHIDGDPASLPSNALLQLAIDKANNLWVLTLTGKAGIFNTKNFSFHEAVVKPDVIASFTTIFKKLITDEFGNAFLLFAGSEVLMWDKAKNSFTALHHFFPVKKEWAISGFAQQPGTQKYWMGLQDGGMAVYNKATGHLSYTGNNIEQEPAIDKFKNLPAISNLFFDTKGRCWFVSWTKEFPNLYCFDQTAKPSTTDKFEFFSLFKTYNEINEIFQQHDGTVWIRGVKVFGRYLETKKKFEMVHAGYENERSIDYRVITCLYEDREMNIWVGTAINGVFRFNPSQEFFTNVMHISRSSGQYGDGSPLSYLPEKDGSLLVGTRLDGLYRYDKNFAEVPLNIKGIADKNVTTIWDIAPSADSNVAWFSSNAGIYQYNKLQRSASFFKSNVLDGQLIKRIAEDKNGNLWLGTQTEGVFIWNPLRGKRKFDDGLMKFNAIPDVKINNISIDSKGLLWIATTSSGLYVVDAAANKIALHFYDNARDEQRLMEQGATAALDYNDSLMIITTPARILIYNRNRKKIRTLGSPQTTSGNIQSVQKDNYGNLWISTTTALYRATIKNRVFIRFNRDDGITNDYFIMASSHKLPDGRLLFGCAGQFVVFDPAAILISDGLPHITITDFKVMNKSLPVDSLLQLKQIELGYKDNSLSVDFSMLAYMTAQMIQYKMENIDKEWKAADKNSQAIYSYLPPGKYTLQFKTINADGKITISPLQLNILINSPFWKTWWFYSILALLAGAVLFLFDKARMQRKETLLKMRNDIAGNLHEEINTALNNINILSEMAKLKADREPQKSKEFIEQIHSKSHRMIIAMDDMLWSISPHNDSMEKTVARMQEYIDSMNNRRGTHNKMLADDKVKTLNLDMQFRHEAFLLFKESINSLLNIGVVTYKVYVMMEKSNLLYSINFNNDACDKQQLSSMLEKLETGRHAAAIHARLNLQIQKNSSVLDIKMLVV